MGHTLFGIALARRLGVRSPLGLAAAVVAASLPDADVIAGAVLYRDPWRLHRKASHTLGFAVSAGLLAGATGIVSAGNADGERDVIADALTGAVLVGSHIALDNLPVPYLSSKRHKTATKIAGVSAFNWLLDAAIYGVIAWKLWPWGAGDGETAR